AADHREHAHLDLRLVSDERVAVDRGAHPHLLGFHREVLHLTDGDPGDAYVVTRTNGSSVGGVEDNRLLPRWADVDDGRADGHYRHDNQCGDTPEHVAGQELQGLHKITRCPLSKMSSDSGNRAWPREHGSGASGSGGSWTLSHITGIRLKAPL